MHAINVSVFAKEYENVAMIEQALRALVPLDFEQEKLKVVVQEAEGFEGIIRILSIHLLKPAHTNKVVEFLQEQLTQEQKELLEEQAESRLDKELNYFVRFDKDFWVAARKLELTDSGNCFHYKFVLAAYPKKREIALPLAKSLLTQKNI